jgi:hypothetical protein
MRFSGLSGPPIDLSHRFNQFEQRLGSLELRPEQRRGTA